MAEQQKRILIVDDDVELGELLAQAVRDMSSSYAVKIAQNVDEAMGQVRGFQSPHQAFDLVITDVKMTGLSGLELLEVLQSVTPATKTIVMTAYNSAELAERAQALNVYAYLTKPFVLSEFRRIVQRALASPAPIVPATPAPPEPEPAPSPELSDAQRAAVGKQLASLRSMTSSSAALLVHVDGMTLVVDALESSQDMDDLGTALMSAQQRIAQQLSLALNTDLEIRQSYFGTESYSVCTYRLNESYFVALVFGPAVKEGQIWYYMRDAVAGLTGALEAAERTARASQPAPAKESRGGDVFISDMLNQFFPDQAQTPRGRGRTPSPSAGPARAPASATTTPERIPAPTTSAQGRQPEAADQASSLLSFEQAQELGLVNPDALSEHTEGADAGSRSAQASEPAALPQTTASPSLNEIDWHAPADMDWDALVAETEQGFGGMTLEQARQRGLIDPELGGTSPPKGQSDPANRRLSLDEIDWNASPDADLDFGSP